LLIVALLAAQGRLAALVATLMLYRYLLLLSLHEMMAVYFLALLGNLDQPRHRPLRLCA
jgi:hypothetical protein